MRAILIGKTKPMYVAVWRFFFHNAALQGLDRPARQVTGPGPATADAPLAPADEGRTADVVDLPDSAVYPSGPAPTGRPLRKRVPLVALVLDFETAEHDGAFEAMAIEFGGAPLDHYGRVIGCRVHLCRFLLKTCGNDPMDAFMRAVLAMRDSPPPGGLAAVRVELEALSARASVSGEGKKVELIKWMLNNGSALRAAFPLSAGALSRTEVLAAGQSTNASESLNLQTQVQVKDRGPRTLLGVIKTLMEFDALVMSEVMPTGKGFSVGGDSEQVHLTRSLNRRKRNAIPAGGAPPKASPRKKVKAPRVSRGVPPASGSGGARLGTDTTPLPGDLAPSSPCATAFAPSWRTPYGATASVPPVPTSAAGMSQHAPSASDVQHVATGPSGPPVWTIPPSRISQSGWPPVVAAGGVPYYPSPPVGNAWSPVHFNVSGSVPPQ